jgi:hypothetical protein
MLSNADGKRRGGTMKKIPYGITDFRELRNGDYYYVDKTGFIEALLNMDYPAIFRPEGMGKSLFASTLKYYLDYKYEDEFNFLFEGTYIGEYPEVWQNSLAVLSLDFSELTSDPKEFREDFDAFIYRKFEEFIVENDIESFEMPGYYECAGFMMDFFEELRGNIDYNIFVIIENVDSFAIEMYKKDPEALAGFLNYDIVQFFDALDYLAYGGLEAVVNIFVTGVTPLVMHQKLTDISLEGELHNMLGFTTIELKLAADAVAPENVDVNQAMLDMVTLYKGHRFSLSDPQPDWDQREELDEELETELRSLIEFSAERENHLFNPAMTLWYLKALAETGVPPKRLIDPRLRSYAKIKEVALIKMRDKLDHKALLSSVVQGYLEEAVVSESFSSYTFTEDDFLSFMFYMGYLTILRTDDDGVSTMMIPNSALTGEFRSKLRGRK